MYHDHFFLRCNPFQPTPAAEFFFASRSHREGLAALQWGLSDPTGLVLLSGDVGTGKTTVIRELLSRETGEVRTTLITNPKLPFDQLLESILRQLKEAVPESRARMLEALTQAAERNRIVVVIDEAQQLSDEGLEDFRLLSNYRPDRLQLMLAGQPELLERLSSPNLRQLNQRIAIRAVLSPFGPAETVDYLQHRIRTAGGDVRKIFTWRALRLLARLSGGIPRRVNVLSHNAMLSAYGGGSKRVRPSHVMAAARECDQSRVPVAAPIAIPAPPVARPAWRQTIAPAMLVAAGITLGVLYTNSIKGSDGYRTTPKAFANTLPIDKLFDRPTFASTVNYHLEKSATEMPPPSVSVGLAPVSLAHLVAIKIAGDPSPQPKRAKELASLGDGAARIPVEKAHELSLPTSTTDQRNDEVVVQFGDTLSGIAQRHGNPPGTLDVNQLVAANPEIKDANLIYPGERVRLTTTGSTHEDAQ